MKLNVKGKEFNFNTPTKITNDAHNLLNRLVATHLLWEDTFYTNGVDSYKALKEVIPQCEPGYVAYQAYHARHIHGLRHAPMVLLREMARLPKFKNLVGTLIPEILTRADMLSEFLVLYWNDNQGKKTISAQVKYGLAKAFQNFNEYQLAKYNNKDAAVKLRDVLFLVHAKPKDQEQENLWKKLITDTLETPNTWEVKISGSGNTKENWSQLLIDRALGELAFLRNLRNMEKVGISKAVLKGYGDTLNWKKVFPYQFIQAAKNVPSLEDILEPWFLYNCKERRKLPGKTVIVIDTSGSMQWPIANKSDTFRVDAAAAIACQLREICEEVSIYTFTTQARECAPRHGFALRDSISNAPSGGTVLGTSLKQIHNKEKTYDRIVVITDEQTYDSIPNPLNQNGVIINVSNDLKQINNDKWLRINGFSNAIIDYYSMLQLGEI